MPPRAADAEADQLTRVVRRFAENVVASRRRSAITQEDAAGAADLHRTEISLLERGLRIPGLDTIVRVAAGVGAEPCELLVGMAWRIDSNRLHGAKPPAGGFEVALGSRWEEIR